MKFQTFAQLLHPIIGAGNSTDTFTRSLFDAIVTDEGQAVLTEYSKNTYKAYFNGNTEITKLARKISAYIEPEEFCGYFNQFSDAAVESLCDSFQEYLPDITPHNAGEKLAGLFASIIKDAASAKKKSASPGAKNDNEESAYDVLSGKVLAAGQALADTWGQAIKHIADHLDEDKKEEDAADEQAASYDEKVRDTARIQIVDNPTIVNQYGEKNIHINHVDTLNL